MKQNPTAAKLLLTVLGLVFVAGLGLKAQPSPRPDAPPVQPAPKPWSEVDFHFGHDGFVQTSLEEFVRAIDSQYHVEWSKVLYVDNDLNIYVRQVGLPQLRLNQESANQILRGDAQTGTGLRGASGFGAAQQNPLLALIALYNNLGSITGNDYGQLTVVGDLSKPSIVSFKSSQPKPKAGTRYDVVHMQAFPMNEFPTNEWRALNKSMEEDLNSFDNEKGISEAPAIQLHESTGLLVITGDANTLQAASSIYQAWHVNAQVPRHAASALAGSLAPVPPGGSQK